MSTPQLLFNLGVAFQRLSQFHIAVCVVVVVVVFVFVLFLYARPRWCLRLCSACCACAYAAYSCVNMLVPVYEASLFLRYKIILSLYLL